MKITLTATVADHDHLAAAIDGLSKNPKIDRAALARFFVDYTRMRAAVGEDNCTDVVVAEPAGPLGEDPEGGAHEADDDGPALLRAPQRAPTGRKIA